MALAPGSCRARPPAATLGSSQDTGLSAARAACQAEQACRAGGTGMDADLAGQMADIAQRCSLAGRSRRNGHGNVIVRARLDKDHRQSETHASYGLVTGHVIDVGMPGAEVP